MAIIMIINKQVKLTAEKSMGIAFHIPSSLCRGAVDARGVAVTCGIEGRRNSVGANTC